MVAKIKILPGTRFSNLVIVKEVEKLPTGKEFKRAVEVLCDCGHIFVVRHNALKTGNTTSCGCMGVKYVTAKNREDKLISCLSDTNSKRGDSRTILDGLDLINLECKDCGGIFSRSFNSIISKGAGNHLCQRSGKLTDDGYIEKVNKSLELTTLSFYSKTSSVPLKVASDIFLECSDCQTITKRRVSVAVDTKIGCPCKTKYGFNPSKSAYLYLLDLVNVGGIRCFKYGITKNLDERHSIISRSFDGAISVWYYWEYESGHLAQEHESKIKKALPSYLNKTDLRDGWTETFDELLLSSFLSIQDTQYKEQWNWI